MSRRAVVLASIPLAVSLALAAWYLSRPPSTVFRVLYSDDIGQWGIVHQENDARYLRIGTSEERLPYDGEHYVVCTRTRCPFAVIRSFVPQADFPVVVRLGENQEPGYAYRVHDGAVVWQSR